MINKVTLIGNLGQDPDLKTLENGTAVARFSVATNENYKDKDGQWQKVTEWHNVVVWRELAERAAANLKKGGSVYVEGKITYRKYKDKDGVEKTVTDIVANVARSLERKETPSDQAAPQPHQAPASTAPDNTPIAGDDLPF